MWANFLDINSDGSISSKYTCKQVLEEFCKFFGYTCRINGISVFFTQPTENTATFTRFTALNGTGVEVARSTFNITNEMFATNDNHEEIHPGIGKVTVTGKNYKAVMTFKQNGRDQLVSVSRKKNKVTVKLKTGNASNHHIMIDAYKYEEDGKERGTVRHSFDTYGYYNQSVPGTWGRIAPCRDTVTS